MCLAIPGKVISLSGEGIEREAEIDFDGARRRVNLAFTPEAGIDGYVLVHVGFAISTLEPDDAEALYRLIEDASP